MALVVLSKVEQRLDAVRAVLGGAKVSEVAGSVGVSRQRLHTWLTRYLLEGGRAGGPVASARVVSARDAGAGAGQGGGAAAATFAVGAKRIRMELLKTLVDGETIPATATINRILIKLGLVQPRSETAEGFLQTLGTAEADAAVATRHRRRGMAG